PSLAISRIGQDQLPNPISFTKKKKIKIDLFNVKFGYFRIGAAMNRFLLPKCVVLSSFTKPYI
ncbi:hypothetical protein Q8G50_32675, partial [Klebsiella pneumoniae]